MWAKGLPVEELSNPFPLKKTKTWSLLSPPQVPLDHFVHSHVGDLLAFTERQRLKDKFHFSDGPREVLW